MNTEENTTVAVFRDARPGAPSYDPRAKAQARARLLNAEPASSASSASAASTAATTRSALGNRMPIGRRRLLTLGAFTAALAIGVPVVQNIEFGDRAAVTPGGTPRPPVLGPVANAEDLADNAAALAATEPAGRPRPDQWGYVKHVMAGSSAGSGGALFGPPDRRITIERWRRVDGKRTASMINGRLQVHDLSPMEMSAVPRDDYPYLLSLPQDPDTLLAEAAKQGSPQGGGAPAQRIRPEEAFGTISLWMREAALPPKLRAAMYGALAKIPGVRYEPTARDIAGRKGVTLYLVVEGYLRNEIIIDPRTYEYMGFRDIAIRDHVSQGTDMDLHTKKGQILGWGGVLKAAIVDRSGQRP